MILDFFGKKSFDFKIGDFKIVGDFGGQLIELFVDIGVCVLVIDEQFVRKIYGLQLVCIIDGFILFVKIISGEKVLVLGKIDVVVKINGNVY